MEKQDTFRELTRRRMEKDEGFVTVTDNSDVVDDNPTLECEVNIVPDEEYLPCSRHDQVHVLLRWTLKKLPSHKFLSGQVTERSILI